MSLHLFLPFWCALKILLLNSLRKIEIADLTQIVWPRLAVCQPLRGWDKFCAGRCHAKQGNWLAWICLKICVISTNQLCLFFSVQKEFDMASLTQRHLVASLYFQAFDETNGSQKMQKKSKSWEGLTNVMFIARYITHVTEPYIIQPLCQLISVKPVDRVPRSADIRCPVSDQSILIRVIDLPSHIFKSNSISNVQTQKAV